ncbi:PREDICTED: SKP1-like protein 1B [Ipomoea nil]|uniref:SKP1-like protein 1B n=1 Tax=Ipomoea nil TaxID=35883 RepID=UPI0009010787|nr:PREDICTED: SKP1-like protein 1B [Ipomoea nil]
MSSLEKKVTVSSSDGEVFELSLTVAQQSQTLNRMIEDDYCANKDCIPLPKITGKILAMVVEYCKKHALTSSLRELKAFDDEFIKVDMDTLCDLILAADYLCIKGLAVLTSLSMSSSIINKTLPELCQTFNIDNLTPEEFEQIRRENH